MRSSTNKLPLTGKIILLHSSDRQVTLLGLTHFYQIGFSDTRVSHFQRCRTRILSYEDILTLTSSLTGHKTNLRTKLTDMSDPEIQKENIEVMEEQLKEMIAV